MIYNGMVSIISLIVIFSWLAVVLPIMTAGCLLCAVGTCLVPPERR